MWFTVFICGLGYFVDIYDLILFSIVRVESLLGMGIPKEGIADASELILNSQMVGMMIGGLIFGVLADKKGRMNVLMLSILMYSVVNILNAFVTTVPMYALCRFFAGIGLAGELGVAITLVSEIMPKHQRGYGTTVVATLGITGAVAAYVIHQMFSWQAAFVCGGIMGLLLLLLRVRTQDSTMFHTTENNNAVRGDVSMIFTKQRFGRYASSVAIGIPIWFVIGILVTFAPEFTAQSGSMATIIGGKAVMICYVGLAAGDLASGLLSQKLRSRKKTILIFILLTVVSIAWYLLHPQKSEFITYLQCGLLGFSTGYWAVFVSAAAEQFGTNLRSTVATTVPNVVRGFLVPFILLFSFLRKNISFTDQTIIVAAGIVAFIAIALGLVGWKYLKETYGTDLQFVEH